MSSTSCEVCELWNGQMIVRIFGSPDICELIMLPKSTSKAKSKSEKGGYGGAHGYVEETEEGIERKPWELVTLQSEDAKLALKIEEKGESKRSQII